MSEAAERWLVFAREDLKTAQVALREEIFNQACFHAQQCVEKAVKALVAKRSANAPPRTHFITDLFTFLPSEWFADIKQELVKLDNFISPRAILTRCPALYLKGFPAN